MTQERLPITQRVIDWNRLRYDQVFNYDLACKLLLEETEELFQATTIVDKLDAIGDIVFVSIGVFWKLGFTDKQIQDIFYRIDLTKISLLDVHDWTIHLQSVAIDCIDHRAVGAWPGFTLALYSAFIVAFGALHGLGMQDYFYDVVEAICDSNDTKEIKGKTPANIKANIVKGVNFVPPTNKLLQIVSLHSEQQKGV